MFECDETEIYRGALPRTPVAKTFDMTAVWTEMADDLRAEAIEQCGHLPHEEQPEKVNGLLVEFLESWRG